MKFLSVSKSKIKDQTGLASILVTMIIMVVISLIVLAAAQLARRGQQQAFDRQLSTQAFYAAESGVNDAVEAISANTALISTDYNSTCNGFTDAAGLDTTLSDNAKYSCLLVDPTPINWEAVVGDTSRTTPVRGNNNENIQSITIAWQSKEGDTDFASCTSSEFEPANSRSCKTPVMRIDLVSTANPTRANLNNNNMTAFLLPVGSGGVSTFGFSANQVATKQRVLCSDSTSPKYCKVTITGLSGTGYYLKMKSVYGSASVTVTGSNTNNDTTKLELKDSQIVIDSTGKANDVLRRIQVRVPFTGSIPLPEFAIQSADTICKVLEVDGASATSTRPLDEPCRP